MYEGRVEVGDEYVVLADAPSEDVDEFDFIGDWDDAVLTELLSMSLVDDLQGVELATHLLAAGRAPWNCPDLTQILDRAASWDRVASWAQAQRTRALADFAEQVPPVTSGPGEPARGPKPLGDGVRALTSEFAPDEVAAALSLAPRTAAIWLGQALSLVHELPATLAAVEDGTIPFAVAATIDRETTGLSREHRASVEAKVLAKAPGRTPGAVGDSTRRAAARTDPVGTARRRAEAAQGSRGVRLRGREDGLVAWDTVLRAEEGVLAFATLDAYAAANAEPGEEFAYGGLASRRADVLMDLITALRERRLPTCLGLADSDPESAPRPVIDIQVVVDASTVLRADEATGEVIGVGPVPAEVARALANDPTGTWHRLLTHPNPEALKEIVELSSASYRPPPALRKKIKARDRTCRFPGCRRRGRGVDLDHTIPWPRGETSESNLGLLCKHHHRLKHEGGWTLQQPVRGRFVWTSPTGATYTVGPDLELHEPDPDPTPTPVDNPDDYPF
jgi:Domain of unknown function (DUF222)/HNH endonuclease